jgi:hypothetical protein
LYYPEGHVQVRLCRRPGVLCPEDLCRRLCHRLDSCLI